MIRSFGQSNRATADLAAWTKISFAEEGDRSGVFINNRSSQYMFLFFKSATDTAPVGATTSDSDTFLAPGESRQFDIGSQVSVWALQGDPLTAGYVIKETK